jgi:ATP-binding cassette subfamily B protein
MAAGLILVLAVTSLAMIPPYISGLIVDQVMKNGDVRRLSGFLLIIIVSVILKSIFRYLYLMIFEFTSQNVVFKIREDMYKKLLSMDFKFFDKTKTGDIMARMTGDADAVRHMVAWVVYQAFENSAVFVVGIGLLCTISIKLTLILLTITPIVAYFAYKLAITVRPTFMAIREQFSRLNSVVQENISGNRVVKAFSKENFEIEKFEKENTAFLKRNLENAVAWSKYLPVLDSSGGALSAIMLLVGGYMVMTESITMGQLVAYNSLLWTLNNPLRMCGWIINDVQRFSASAEKIISFMRNKPVIKSPDSTAGKDRISGKIEFKNVSFSYGDEKVLEDISFKAYPGQTIAIVGPTGSGKSTVVNLISRFYDVSSGEILIDDTNIKDFDVIRLRRDIAMAMQDIFLFSDTIEGNIAYGVPGATFEDVKRAAEIAEANEFIESFPEGYDTIIGERGVGLSGGQKQRIALARAIMKNPAILILDDTTSSVDMETEYSIQKKLARICEDRTTFVIAHRISSVKNADLILVVNEGRVVEQGKHDDLIKMEGYYYSVFMSQYGDFEKLVAGEVV